MLRLKSMVQLSQYTKQLTLNEINRSNGVFIIARRYISKTKLLFKEVDGVLQGESKIENDTCDTSDKSLVPQFDETVPKVTSVLVLPITSRPTFPGFHSAITIKNEKIIEALNNAGDAGQYVGLFLRADTDKSDTTDTETSTKSAYDSSESEIITHEDQLYKVGIFAQIYSSVKSPLGTHLLLKGRRRINLDSISSFGPPCISTISYWPKENKSSAIVDSPLVKAYINQIIEIIREIMILNPLTNEYVQQYNARLTLSDPYKIADFAATMTTANGKELQKVLECYDAEERLSLALDLLYKEREWAKIQKDLNDKAEAKLTKQQREYMLREKMKRIEEELNIRKDDKDELIEQYESKLYELTSRQVNPQVSKTLEEEIQKLSFLDRNSSEFSVTRSYLDWLTHIPWNLFTKDKFHLKKAQKVLDEDHYGMDEVKKRILEFMAVGKLKKNMTSGATGKIICLIGPPGVGKTSIAKSIANALDRKFYRFSVGGLTDMAEIKGHRRTYIGAMPGKPIQCLKTIGYMNPVILIDEIDKLGRGGYNGDPASALLELLDPNQNSSFVDHYLDVPTDFSQVLFICTGNDESTIPGPLRDRMEIIRLSGYDITEKVAIATRYLVPKAVKDSGLTESPHHYHIELTSTCLEELIKNYCRESGVRSLEKHIEKLIRKIAFDVVSEQERKESEQQPLQQQQGDEGGRGGRRDDDDDDDDDTDAAIINDVMAHTDSIFRSNSSSSSNNNHSNSSSSSSSSGSNINSTSDSSSNSSSSSSSNSSSSNCNNSIISISRDISNSNASCNNGTLSSSDIIKSSSATISDMSATMEIDEAIDGELVNATNIDEKIKTRKQSKTKPTTTTTTATTTTSTTTTGTAANTTASTTSDDILSHIATIPAETVTTTTTTTTITTVSTAPESTPAPTSVNIMIHESDLEKYLGKPRYSQETIYDSSKDAALPPGIVMGLAWNPSGGSPIFIETAAIPTAVSETGGGVNVVTGQLGSVMKESANIAYTFARRFIHTMAPENLFFKCHQLHLHVPEGAVEKDGPSAGVAMACSFISLSTNTSIIPHLAMTGELSLTGLVLPVGGIKEKILAGRRAGATSVILPHSNRRDYDELPNYVKESITVHFARDFSDVYKIAFPSSSSSSTTATSSAASSTAAAASSSSLSS